MSNSLEFLFFTLFVDTCMAGLFDIGLVLTIALNDRLTERNPNLSDIYA